MDHELAPTSMPPPCNGNRPRHCDHHIRGSEGTATPNRRRLLSRLRGGDLSCLRAAAKPRQARYLHVVAPTEGEVMLYVEETESRWNDDLLHRWRRGCNACMLAVAAGRGRRPTSKGRWDDGIDEAGVSRTVGARHIFASPAMAREHLTTVWAHATGSALADGANAPMVCLGVNSAMGSTSASARALRATWPMRRRRPLSGEAAVAAETNGVDVISHLRHTAVHERGQARHTGEEKTSFLQACEGRTTLPCWAGRHELERAMHV